MITDNSLLIEAALLTDVIMVCIISSFTDLKYGIVKNEMIIIAGMIGIVLDFLYYLFAGREFLTVFLLNFAALSIISVSMYMLRIWAAGDSKLLLILSLLIPGKYYYSDRSSIIGVAIIFIIFAIAYVYLIFESIYIGIKQKNIFKFSFHKIEFKATVLSYLKCLSVTVTLVSLIRIIFPEFASNNLMLISLIRIAVLFAAFNIGLFERKRLFPIIIICAVFTGGYCILVSRQTVNPGIYLIALIIFMLRGILNKYNYQTIATGDVKKGMILSQSTVLQFSVSRVKGLPKETTEDLKSRITQDEADSIKRWETSKYGSPEIVIVRRISFAVFIAVGTIAFIAIRMLVI